LCVGALLVAGMVTTARGQSLADSYRTALRESVARIAADRRAADSVRNVARARYEVGITHGPVTVMTDSPWADTVRGALVVMDSVLSMWMLPRPSTLSVAYRFHPEWGEVDSDTISKVRWFLDRVDGRSSESSRDWWNTMPSARVLGVSLAMSEKEQLNRQLPDAVQKWLNVQLTARRRTDTWTETYLKLATSETVLSRTCLMGSIKACRQMLLLEPTADPVVEWFTPSARRAQVARLRSPQLESFAAGVERSMPGALGECIDSSNDAACIRIIKEKLGVRTYGDPLQTPIAREALVIAALDLPGAPGISAVIGRSALSVEDALQAMSGTTTDAVVLAWLQQVRSSEPEIVQLPARRLTAALAWTLVAGALALKGSRWRSA